MADPPRASMVRYVALLRAINTPPRHVRMPRLRSVFTDLGLENVASVIASGNIVFDTDDATNLGSRIEAALVASLGFEVPTFLRTTNEMLQVVARQPFPTDEGEVDISFLASEPTPQAAAAVVATASGSDRLAIVGSELYWWRPGTPQRSTHSEERVVRLLGMLTTRRSLGTIQRIIDGHLGRDTAAGDG